MPESLDMSLQRVALRQQQILKRRSATWWMIFLIPFAHDAPGLEGNALALHETPVVLKQGITTGGKPCANIWKLRISREH